MTYDYLVSNTGNVVLTNLFLDDTNDNDDAHLSCDSTTLAVGASVMCHATHTFTQAELDAGLSGRGPNNTDPIDCPTGLYNFVTATTDEGLSATDYLCIPIVQTPSIDIEKATNGVDADTPTGPAIPMGDPVAWTYVVTNTGNVTLAVVVSDDQGVSVSCPETSLAPADDMTCNAIGVAVAGQYANIGTADGTPDVGAPVQATDPSHYFGEDPGMTIVKTSGTQSLSSPQTVTYDYLVSNTGNVVLTNLFLDDTNDNDDAHLSCDSTTLAVGASVMCHATHTFTQG